MRASRIIVVTALLYLTACGSLGYHQVRDGDTLYSIAWTYGYDATTVARWNHLSPPYHLSTGQWLRVAPPPDEGAPAAPPAAAPRTLSEAGSPRPAAVPAAPAAAPNATRLTWEWPARGKLLSRFAAGRPAGKGVDIGGRIGEPVRAAAAGRVVYSGSGLIGYGNLIIIKHNEHFLSAYAYNRRLFVKEGDTVAMGDEIAEMGGPAVGQAKLHFEIRRDGDPVDPLKFLPGGTALR